MDVALVKPGRMTVAEFLLWTDEQPEAQFELLDGQPVAMTGERIAHARRKLAICDQLRAAIANAGLPCETLIDGVAVAPDELSVFIPDVVVCYGEPLDGDERLVPNPIIIVEVLSPSTRALDLTYKLGKYFLLPSLVHYLVARTDSLAFMHYRRAADAINLTIVHEGPLLLDPPGMTLTFD